MLLHVTVTAGSSSLVLSSPLYACSAVCSSDGHLRQQFLAVINKAAMNICADFV